MNMRFSDFLSIIHKYVASNLSQHDFMLCCFQKLMVKPDVESDEAHDEVDDYYPFSKKSNESLAKKVYSGSRLLPSKTAMFIGSHFSAEAMQEEIDSFDDSVKENLCGDLSAYGFSSNIDEIANDVPMLFKRFIEAAINEKDSIETGVISKSEISIEADSETNRDALLLIEAGNRCPVCGKLLLYSDTRGRSRREYSITQIFPENLDRFRYVQFSRFCKIGSDYNIQSNLIALCSGCSAEYKAGLQLSDFQEMLEKKKQLQQRQRLQQLSDRLELEAEIREVVNGLAGINPEMEMVPLKMDALVVDKKIGTEDQILLSTIKSYAAQYYRFIESIFADLDERRTGTFDIIATQFRQMFLKLKAEKFDTPSIFDGITNWVKAKAGVCHADDTAVRIIVSFFVQNCEVFDEIPE